MILITFTHDSAVEALVKDNKELALKVFFFTKKNRFYKSSITLKWLRENLINAFMKPKESQK